MNESEIREELRDLRKDISNVSESLGDLKSDVAVLVAKLNGGPGHTQFCRQHAERMDRLESIIGDMTKRFWLAYGGFIVAIFMLNFFASQIKQFLKLP